jgi:hypothetical protein
MDAPVVVAPVVVAGGVGLHMLGVMLFDRVGHGGNAEEYDKRHCDGIE